jgi:hypothetical protein
MAAPDGARGFSFHFNKFISIHLNCALGAAPQHGVAAPNGAIEFVFCLFYFISIYFNFASGAAPRRGVAAIHRTTDFFKSYLVFNYFNILELHQVPLHNKELRHQTGHQTFRSIYFNFHHVPLNNKELRHQTEHHTFVIIITITIIIYLNLFELSIRCRSTPWSWGTGLFVQLF